MSRLMHTLVALASLAVEQDRFAGSQFDCKAVLVVRHCVARNQLVICQSARENVFDRP